MSLRAICILHIASKTFRHRVLICFVCIKRSRNSKRKLTFSFAFFNGRQERGAFQINTKGLGGSLSTVTKSLNFTSLVEESNNRIADIKREQSSSVTGTARNLGFAGFALLGLMLLGTIMFQIITGVIALVVGLGAVALMIYAYRYLKMADPLIKQKMRNHVLKKMIEEAKTHKIETLTNMVIESGNRLNSARAARDKMGGFVNKINTRLKASNQESSNFDRKVEMTEKVELAYEMVKANVNRAANAHKALEVKVRDYKEMAEFSDMVGDALKFANDSNGNKLEEMLGMEAFAAIEQDFHEAMVSVENSVADYEIDNG
ncbi:hypothetical protein [Enterovibrio norvegicus]|uniref:hypothetical protein n=1 Tax=Enterovibrio norvegicus TaxID=188144 RepID=UPI001F537EB4|nr:hypothetical protein [Enterovibrio norvegicus]